MGDLVDKYILLAASANAPKETGVHSMYNVVSLSLLVERDTHCIYKAKVNMPSELTQAYFADLLEGFCVLDAPDALYQEIRKNVLIPSAGAVIQALKMAFQRYRDKIEEKNE